MSLSPPVEVRNRQGERIDFAFHPGSPERRDIVILAHGVTSNKDRPWLVEISHALEARGVASLRISFAGNGASEGRFQDATPTKESEDLGSVIDAVARAGFERIAYAGHSMGGAVGVMRAAVDSRIAVLVSLAGMVHVQSFMQEQFGTLVPGRDCMLGKPECLWSESLKKDAARIGSLVETASRIRVPWLLVHGDADELVPIRDSIDAVAATGGAKLTTLPGVDHRFTGAIPQLVEAVVPWLCDTLGTVPQVPPERSLTS